MDTIRNLGALPHRTGQDDRVAIVDLLTPGTPKSYSYGELDGLIDGVSAFLTSLGLEKGARVAILSLNRAEYIATYLGIMRARMIAVPVNIKLPLATIEAVIADCGAEFMFVDSDRVAMAASTPYCDFDDQGPAGFAARIPSVRFELSEAEPDEIAQILYTSGSTGMPKGVPLTHSGMLWALQGALRLGLENERQIVAQPLFHMNGLMVVNSVLHNGSSIVVMPSFNARLYSEALEQWGVTRVFAVPTMLARVLREVEGKAVDFSKIKQITLSSAPTTEALIKAVSDMFSQAVVDVSYGCTEGGPRIFGPHPNGSAKPVLALGTPVDGCEIRLENGTPAEGELFVRNPAVMPGYLNLPGKTAEVLDDGWYRTKDIMRRDPDGFYYFVGRADDMFICSGENIYPGEVEKVLEKHPSVQQVAVVPLNDEERGQIPVAFIVTRKGMSAGFEDIRSHAIANGPAYQHPRRIAVVTELPLAGTNKIDRKALLEAAVELERNGGWSR